MRNDLAGPKVCSDRYTKPFRTTRATDALPIIRLRCSTTRANIVAVVFDRRIMRLAQSANGSDLGNCCETVTQFISLTSRSCFGTMRGHETGAGNLAGAGRCFVQTTHWTEILHARPTESSTQPAEARYLPLRWGDDPCVFCPKREESMNGKKNLMLAAIQLIKVSAVVFAISALSFGVGFLRASSHAEAHAPVVSRTPIPIGRS